MPLDDERDSSAFGCHVRPYRPQHVRVQARRVADEPGPEWPGILAGIGIALLAAGAYCWGLLQLLDLLNAVTVQ